MKKTMLLFAPLMVFSNMLLFDFNLKSDLSNWRVVDDVVMGGRSNGSFEITDLGHGLFKGDVSLENNGGFSSVRYRFEQKNVAAQGKFVLKLKGDGKRYQFRVKSDKYDRHSYIYYFQTTGDWQTIEIPLSKMYPTFRGMELNMPNYPGQVMEEIAFLISNKKAEAFQLEIDRIGLE